MEMNLTNFYTRIIEAVSETYSKSKKPHDDATQKYLARVSKYSATNIVLEDKESELKLLPDSGTIDKNVTTFVNFCQPKARKDVCGAFGGDSSTMLGLVLVAENQISFSMKAPVTRKPAFKKS